jgi:hypothetical protein
VWFLINSPAVCAHKGKPNERNFLYFSKFETQNKIPYDLILFQLKKTIFHAVCTLTSKFSKQSTRIIHPLLIESILWVQKKVNFYEFTFRFPEAISLQKPPWQLAITIFNHMTFDRYPLEPFNFIEWKTILSCEWGNTWEYRPNYSYSDWESISRTSDRLMSRPTDCVFVFMVAYSDVLITIWIMYWVYL